MRITPARRGIAALMACILLLAGCASQTGTGGQPQSAAQMQLQQANDRFRQTVGQGAAMGAALGTAMGYVVARKNYLQAKTEENLKQLIAAAHGDADAYHRSAV